MSGDGVKSSVVKPEVMSPVGYWPQVPAAIEAGADAVYFGLTQFSARAKVGFEIDELPDLMHRLHKRRVKGFVTSNTLVFDNELRSAERAIAKIAEAGVDAIIVQDLAIVQLAKQIAPHLDIHGSTQMSVTTAQGADLCQQLGCNRVVLGRELSLKDIQRIANQTDVELEVFVHGALCVSYSGQCFSSEAWGGRSANRGQCAQACRLSYELVVDGEWRDTGADRYLLSPGDLYAVEQVPELMRIGVSCLKIEGRYKDENYVALTTRAYREAVDRAYAELTQEPIQSASGDLSIGSPVAKTQLEQVYSRGLGPHFIQGTDHQSVVTGRAPRHRGVLVGEVARIDFEAVVVEPCEDIRPGDGVAFDAADWRSPDEPEEGGNIYEVDHCQGRQVRLAFADGAIDFSRIRVGDRLWRANDPQLLVQLKPLAKPKSIIYTRPVDIVVSGQVGEPLRVIATFDDGRQVTVESAAVLAAAQKRALDESTLREQLGRLGDSPFHLGKLSIELTGDLFLPVSQLNATRRDLVEQMLATRQRISVPSRTGMVGRWYDQQAANAPAPSDTALRFHLLVRTPEQLDAAIECRPASITLDYLELYGLRPSVEKIVAAGLQPRVASPRILKPVEQKVVRFLLSLQCPIVVRSGGLLVDLLKVDQDARPSLIGDFSLNAANVMTARQYLDMGLDVITPTYDLNAEQVAGLVDQIEPSHLEVITYSHLPVFHTEHCVFCRFLSNGTDNTNCGHPCESHRVELEDQRGRRHPVMADVGCRNTVFGGEAQFSVRGLQAWTLRGLADFRIEFVRETADHVSDVYQAFSQWRETPQQLDRLALRLSQVSPAGISEGSLFVPLQTK